MVKVAFAVILSGLSASISFSLAGDIVAGKKAARNCAGCHGMDGISRNPLWPNLAGQKKAYIARQLKDYRTGVRKSAQMTYWAKALSAKDIENVAAYYESLQPSCKKKK